MLCVLNTSATLGVVIEVRAAQEDAGVDRRSAPRWETLFQGMYHHRTSLVWPTLNHICMTADSSTHCYEDTMLAMCYSWEIDQACYPTLQHIVTGTNPSLFSWWIGIGASQHFAATVMLTVDWDRPSTSVWKLLIKVDWNRPSARVDTSNLQSPGPQAKPS